MSTNRVFLNDIKKLRVAYEKHELSPIKSMDFHHNGEHIAYNTNSLLSILSCSEENVRRTSIKTDEFGAGLCKFFDNDHVVHTSTVQIRMLNIKDELKSMNFFPGHSRAVTSLDCSSLLIVSGSEDSTVRIWDPRHQECIKILHFNSSEPLVAFHPAGDMLAVAYDCMIEIFSTNNLESGVGKTQFEKIHDVKWTSIKFSPNGKMLMATTNSSCIMIFDVIMGQELHNLIGFENPDNESIGACFSPESDFVLGGSIEGLIHVWDLKSSFKVHSLQSGYKRACYNVAFNPKFANLATTSADNKIHLWIEKQ